MPTVGLPALAATANFPKQYFHVFMKTTWAGPWLYQPYVKPRRYEYNVAPGVSRADVLYHFGYMNMEDVITSRPYPLFRPYNAGPWYVLLAIQEIGYPLDIHWVGQLAEDPVTVDRPTVPSGYQSMTAYGFEHILDRCMITKSYVKQAGNETKRIDHVLPFNVRHDRGGQLFGNESGTVDANGVFRFYDPTDTNPPGRWTNKEIIEYLLQYFVNTLHDDTASPIQFRLAGQTAALQQIFDVYDFGPRDRPVSVWYALNQLIDRRRGLGFVLRTSGAPGAPIYIWVFSHTEAPITAGGATLPANGEQLFFNIPITQPYDDLVGEITLRYSTTNLFSSIVVQGERIRVTGSWRPKDGTLDRLWKDTVQTAYEAEADDEARSVEKYRTVFTTFGPPRNWNWTVKDTAGAVHNILVDADDDGTVSKDANDNNVIGYNYLKTFERDLPFLEGYDYSVSPATNNNEPDAPPEFMKLLVLLPSNSVATGAPAPLEGDFFYVAEKGNEQENDLPNCTIRGVDTAIGVEVKASPNYLIALNRTGAGFTTGDEESVVDYNNMIVTASIYSDVRARVQLNGISVPAPETLPQLTITLPDCHYWYVAPGTIFDLWAGLAAGTAKPTVDGVLVADLPPNVLRDDTDRLRQVAAYLRWWFSRMRQAVTIPINRPGKYAEPGMLITSIITAWTREPINAIITSRRVDFEAGTTEITTGYLELDNMISLLDDPQRRTRDTWGVRVGRRR